MGRELQGAPRGFRKPLGNWSFSDELCGVMVEDEVVAWAQGAMGSHQRKFGIHLPMSPDTRFLPNCPWSFLGNFLSLVDQVSGIPLVPGFMDFDHWERETELFLGTCAKWCLIDLP